MLGQLSKLSSPCKSSSENFEIFVEEAARTAVARVVVTGLTNSNRVAKELNRFENASQIGNAYAGLLKIGPSHCELPTPSAELAKLSASDSLEWIGIHWPEGVIEEWKKSRFTSDQARELAVLGVKPSQLSIWLNYNGEQNETLPDFEFIKLWSLTSLLPAQCIEYARCGLDPVEASSAHDFAQKGGFLRKSPSYANSPIVGIPNDAATCIIPVSFPIYAEQLLITRNDFCSPMLSVDVTT